MFLGGDTIKRELLGIQFQLKKGTSLTDIYFLFFKAQSYPNCIGLVKVMGRSAGFLAAHTALATECVDICLLPEIPVNIDEFLETLKRNLVLQK